MDYPTPTFIRNIVLTSLVGQYAEKLDRPVANSVIWSESEAPKEGTKEGNDLIKQIVDNFDIDLDDFIYDQISNFDSHFENDPEWFCDMEDEGDCFYDEKDRIRDEVLVLIA